MKNRRWIASVVEMALGLVLTVCGALNIVDSYWSGMGGALLFVGCLQLVRYFRYHNNAEYKEVVDVALNDERNKFIALRAWAWAGYLYVLAAAIASIVLRLMDQPVLSVMAGGSVCLLMVFWWGSRIYLWIKY